MPNIARKAGIYCILSIILACVVFALHLYAPQEASEEYKYTVLKIYQFCFYPLAAAALVLAIIALRQTSLGRFLGGKRGWLACLVLGFALVAIPVLSPDKASLHWIFGMGFSVCWALGALSAAIGLFLWAARLNNALSGLLCLVASLFLAIFTGEAYCLFVDEYTDGRWADAEHSKYVLSGVADPHSPAHETEFGLMPKRPDNSTGAAAHRELRFNKEHFDAMYTLTEKDRRITPKANDAPEADLLLFGCSYTFGFGLNDEQTWAWLLAKDLGPSWRVENYAYSGFGVQQMLLFLEQKRIDPPTAPIRQAVFLAINHHVRRNSGLFVINSVSYDLKDNGDLVRGQDTKDSPFRLIFKVPHIMNGSQFADLVSGRVANWLVKHYEPEHTKTYIAMLEKSAKILREQYGTTLNVLVWPDIENIAPELEKRGIPVILARKFLKDWDEKGETAYQIVPVYEPHPNIRAAREVADGLAAYFRKVGEQAEPGASVESSR